MALEDDIGIALTTTPSSSADPMGQEPINLEGQVHNIKCLIERKLKEREPTGEPLMTAINDLQGAIQRMKDNPDRSEGAMRSSVKALEAIGAILEKRMSAMSMAVQSIAHTAYSGNPDDVVRRARTYETYLTGA